MKFENYGYFLITPRTFIGNNMLFYVITIIVVVLYLFICLLTYSHEKEEET